MNTTCPTCGALYNVAEKDIGRKLKCKKCNTALKVTSAGLEVDSGTGTSPPASDPRPAPVPAAAFDDDEDEPVVRKKKDRGERRGGNPLAFLAPIGGVPGVLFSIGVFFVLTFTFFSALSGASNERAKQYKTKLELEKEVEIRKLLPKGKIDPTQLEGNDLTKYNDDKKKIDEKYAPLLREADEDSRATEIGNRRMRLFEGYGQLFGFILVAFGCLGFLLSESALLLRIVTGVILIIMVGGLFKLALGAGSGLSASIGVG